MADRMVLTPTEAMKLDVEKKCEAEIMAALDKHGCTFSIIQTFENAHLVAQAVRVVMKSAALPAGNVLPFKGNGGAEH